MDNVPGQFEIKKPYRVEVLYDPLPTVPANKITPTDKQRVLALGGGWNAPGIIAAMVAYVEALKADWFDVVGLFGSWPALKNVDWNTRMIQFKDIPTKELHKYHTQWGTQLGVGRDILLKDEFHNVVKLKKMLQLICACGVGGDGTLSAAQAFQYSLDPDMKAIIDIVMWVKTIDNDLAHCDTAIGFITAVFKSQESIHCALNLAHGKSTTAVVDLYGRDNWNITLHAASLVEGNHPLITLLSEKPITREHFLRRHAELKRKHNGYVCVVVAEWFKFLWEKDSDDSDIPRDGKWNKKLEGGKLVVEALQKIGETSEWFKPGWDTRECPPIEQDIQLAQAVGRAVAASVKQKLWGTAIVAQGSLRWGIDLKSLPLWLMGTGNPVSLDLYDAENLAPTHECKEEIRNHTHPPVRDLVITSADLLRADHEALMLKIQQWKLGKLVPHNGVRIPKNAIVPDKNKIEQVTKWTQPIWKLLWM